MPPTIKLANESFVPTKSFDMSGGQTGATVETTSCAGCPVFEFEVPAALPPEPPAKHTAIRQLVERWEQDDERRAAIEKARHWVAETFYPDDGDTVRTLRLRKGWSQTRLADELSTSQSHVSRIERGTENLTIETCRKLAKALEIDLNTLDEVLGRQEAIAHTKLK